MHSSTLSRCYPDDLAFLAGRYPEHRTSAERLAAACRELRDTDRAAVLAAHIVERNTAGTPAYDRKVAQARDDLAQIEAEAHARRTGEESR